MRDRNEIVRERQSAIRRELDRRGIALKAVAMDAQISYSTLVSYLPQPGGDKPVMMPAGAIYALAETRAIPDDLLSLLLPAGVLMVRVPEGVDHDEIEEAARDYLAEKAKAHHLESEAGRDIGPNENQALTERATVLKAVAA